MNKIKYLALTALLIAGLGLAGCNKKKTPTPTPDPDPSGGGEVDPVDPVGPVNPDGTVTVYLDLGQIGLYEGKKGNEYADKFLENAIEITGKPGDALPGADKITSTSGAVFLNWMYYYEEGKTGAPTKYEVLPSFNCILLANWQGGSGEQGGGGTPTPPPTPEPGEVTYTINTTSSWNILEADAKFAAWVWGGTYASGSWESITHVSGTGTADVFEATLDASATNIIIVRINPSADAPSWADGVKWGQTNDINLVGGQTSYAVQWQ